MKGSCLCKHAQYGCDSLDGAIIFCHCETCRKALAVPYAATARYKRENFPWLVGSELLTSDRSSPGNICHLCSCGSHLMAERPVLNDVTQRMATLDDDSGLLRIGHISAHMTCYGLQITTMFQPS